MSFELTLLGGFQAQADGQPVRFATNFARALLAYLAMEARPCERTTLVGLLWPDQPEASARQSLRQTLFYLRQALGDKSLTEQPLMATTKTLHVREAAIDLDVRRFQQGLTACATHAHADLLACPACIERLRQVADLYRGDFLQGLVVKGSQTFEEWTLFLREQLRRQAVEVYYTLAKHAQRNSDYGQMLHYGTRQLAMEPWSEEAHRQLMWALAASGQRSAALAQYRACRQILLKELGIEPGAETVALYDQIGKTHAQTLPETSRHLIRRRAVQRFDAGEALLPMDAASPTGDPFYHSSELLPLALAQLPEPLTPFIGRQQELNELLARLQEPSVRLLTLVGAGGMGKTRLALAVARTIAESKTAVRQTPTYADGVFFVSLASLTTTDALSSTIATVLGITVGTDPEQALRQCLRDKQLLLILDNFEHILPGASAVADLLQHAPGVQILVTSRERLNVRGEQLYPVPPLHFAAKATLTEATDAAAVRLFVQSAQQVQANFQLDPMNLATVLRICQLVQGMPLGLELAAANVGLLPLHVIADEIERSANFLAADWQDAPARQRSMRAVFAWSWQLLNLTEQRALRQLAVFRGDFDRVAAQAVTGVTLPILARLIQKSLLQWHESAGNEGRYNVHELLREFAAEELETAGERATVAAQHGRYYLAYLAARGLRLGRREPKEASAEIGAELDNVRQAWQWAASQGQLAELEQATYAWWQFCQFQGLEFEGRQSFAVAIEGMRRQVAITAADAAHKLGGQQLLAKLLALHANYLFAQGCDEEMAAQAREAIELGAASGGVEGETFGAFVLGRTLQELEQKREAREIWQRTIDLVHRYHPSHPESELLHEAHWMAHNFLRGSALHFGDYTDSRTHMVQALQLCQALGKRWGELYCLAALAGVDFLLYDVAAAEAGFVAALDLARLLGYRRVEMVAQDGLAGVLRLRGDYPRAQLLLEQAVSMAAELASPYDEALMLAALIRLHCQLGDQTAAAQRQEQLTRLLARVKLAKECRLYGHLAAAVKAHYAGADQVALHAAEQADQMNQQDGDILFRLVDTALILGHVRTAVGQWDAARAAFHQALTAFQQFAGAHWAQALAAEPQAGLAQIALAQGDLAGALAQIEVILPVLAAEPHAGYNDPFAIYWTCYQVLTAVGDPRATALLQQGYDLLQQAAAVLDDESRPRFLEAVPSHYALMTAYWEGQAQTDQAIV